MTNRNIIQEIIDGYMALKAKHNEVITYDDIPKLTIETAFWFMRITGKHYASLQKGLTPEIHEKQVEEAVEDIQAAICQYFSDIFSDDFEEYTVYMIDDLYNDIDNVQSEWEVISNDACLDASVSEKIQSLIDKTICLQQSIASFRQKFEQDIPSVFENGASPRSVSSIYEYGQQKRNDPVFFTPDEKSNDKVLWNEFKDYAKSLMDAVVNLQEIVQNLFCIDNLYMEKIVSCFDKMDKSSIQSFLYNIRYPSSIHFNLESTLIFMFIEYQIPDRKFSCLINKYETFFTNLYMSLRAKYAMIDTILFPMDTIDHEEALEGYVGAPAGDKFLEKKLSVLNLRKLIALQHFHDSISQRRQYEKEKRLLNRFETLLTYTKMPYIAYNPILDNLPQYIMDTLGINQTDLSKILDVNKSTISRQRENNTLIEKNKWFWIAAAGYTYEYLNGETTISNYGKPTNNYSNTYLIAPAVTLAHGELFLKRVNSLKDYRIRLKRTNSERKTNLLSKKYLQEISKETMAFVEHLRKCRDYIDTLCERERNAEMTAAINLDKKAVMLHSEYATEKLLFYFKIFDRMLDAIQDKHIVEALASLKDKMESRPLELIEKLMNSISLLPLAYINSIDKESREICLTDDFKKYYKSMQSQMLELDKILIDLKK